MKVYVSVDMEGATGIAVKPQVVEDLFPVRYSINIAMAGLSLAFLVVFWPAIFGMPILTHFPRPDEEVTTLGTLELHTAILFDLGVFGLVFGFIVTTMRALMRVEQEGQG